MLIAALHMLFLDCGSFYVGRTKRGFNNLLNEHKRSKNADYAMALNYTLQAIFLDATERDIRSLSVFVFTGTCFLAELWLLLDVGLLQEYKICNKPTHDCSHYTSLHHLANLVDNSSHLCLLQRRLMM